VHSRTVTFLLTIRGSLRSIPVHFRRPSRRDMPVGPAPILLVIRLVDRVADEEEGADR